MTQYCNAQTSHRRESTLQYEGNSGSKRNAQWRARYYHRTPALCCSKSKEEITIQRHFDCPLTTQQKKYKCRVQLLLQAYTAQALLTHNIEFLASPLPQAAQWASSRNTHVGEVTCNQLRTRNEKFNASEISNIKAKHNIAMDHSCLPPRRTRQEQHLFFARYATVRAKKKPKTERDLKGVH